jgi:hypothetical protein
METLETMSFAEIAAFATVAAAASYLLGLVALGWPLYKHITRDAATTQYALSLISKTEIAGYGLRVYAGYPLISAIVSFLFLLLFVTAPRVTLILSWVICLLLILWIFFPRHTENFYLPRWCNSILVLMLSSDELLLHSLSFSTYLVL